nr:hypothetical protein [Prevotella sp.]
MARKGARKRTLILKYRMQFKYGLKAQKLLAQGSALGIMAVNKAPCKGKSFENCLILVKLLPLQGDKLASMITQGAALGYELLPFQGVWNLPAKLEVYI